MSLTDREFAALRHTIALRGTVRVVLLPLTLLAWATLASTLLRDAPSSLAPLLPLAVLAAGFEAVHALHVGIERIGRYLQVFYETGRDGPAWETTAMSAGPPLPGGGVDPLFTMAFLLAVLANLLLLLPMPIGPATGLVAAAHAAFVVRVILARRAAARQRAVDLETYRRLKTSVRGR